jgi:hypothetical protein
VKGLRQELDRVGIRGRLADRIEAELDDHLACNPDAPLGAPRLIAERFAHELGVRRTRRATSLGFAALALCAIGLAAQSVQVHRWPDIATGRGTVVGVAGLAIVLAAQVAFVAGVLAVWEQWLGADRALVQRRLLVALSAGALVVAAEAVDVGALAPLLPRWWLAVALPATVVPTAALASAGVSLRSAAVLASPHVAPPAPFARGSVVSIGAAVVLVMAVGSAVAERSLSEGVFRGAFEAVAFAGGFLALGRFLGIRR